MFDTAIARFNAALAHPSIAPGDPIHSLASVGLARALLNQGRFAEAATAVASVPSDFIYETEHATTPSNLHNGVFEAFNNGEFGVEDQEGVNGLNYVSAQDLRVTGDSGLSWTSTPSPGSPASTRASMRRFHWPNYVEAGLHHRRK